MKLSIVIVSWNTADILAQCLDSIYEFPLKEEFEVWVVDNASTDGSVTMLNERFSQVRLIENENNPGFAGANNQAMQQCQGEYVLLLNPDTVILDDALNKMVSWLDAHGDVGALGPRILNPDHTLQTSSYPRPTLSREFWRLLKLDKLRPYGVYHMSAWDIAEPRQVEALLGACILIRRNLIEAIGLMDEDYFMYTEEIDYCYRISRAGWKLCWLPQATIIHYGGQSTQQVAADMFLQLYKSKLFFFRKHYGRLSGLMYKLILLLATLFRLIVAPLTLLQSGDKRQKNITLTQNYIRMLKLLPSL